MLGASILGARVSPGWSSWKSGLMDGRGHWEEGSVATLGKSTRGNHKAEIEGFSELGVEAYTRSSL